MVRNLTDLTEGNATGIGVADVTTQNLVRKIDWTKVYVNIVTAGVLEGARLPIVADTVQDALGIALRGCIGVHSKSSRIVRIKNTLEMTTVWASEALIPEIEKNSEPSWFGFALTVKTSAPFSRPELIEFLDEQKIASRFR